MIASRSATAGPQDSDHQGASILVVPQWQGSRHPDARALAVGATQLRALQPDAPAVVVDVPGTPSPTRNGVASYEVLRSVQREVRRHVAPRAGGVLTLGGDCGADLAPLSARLERHAGDLAVLWLDAHADLNTPESSPSGAFHGMVLRALTGDGPAGLVPAAPVDPAAVVLLGTRALDPGEAAQLSRSPTRRLGLDAVAEPERVVDALRATGRSRVYVHLDLDVLDPGAFAHVGYPEPGGATPTGALAVLDAVAEALPLDGAFVGEFLGGDGRSPDPVAPLVTRLWRGLADAGGPSPR